VQRILQPHLGQIYDAIKGAWYTYGELYDHSRHVHSLRTRANIVYDHMAFNAREAFVNESDVKIMDINGLFLLNFAGRVLLRFKKLNEDKMPSNLPTLQTIEWFEQLSLPSMPEAIRVVAGYELNSLQTDIKAVYVTCTAGPRKKWYFELTAPQMAEVVDISGIAKPSTPTKRVSAKKAEEAIGEDGNA